MLKIFTEIQPSTVELETIQCNISRAAQEVAVGGPNRRPTNPRWRTAAILKKTVKTPYLCNRLTDFDDIWYSDVFWPLTADLPLKFRIFENPKWRRPLP